MSYEIFGGICIGLAGGLVVGFYWGYSFCHKTFEQHFTWINDKKSSKAAIEPDFLEGCGPTDIMKDDYWWNNGEKPKLKDD